MGPHDLPKSMAPWMIPGSSQGSSPPHHGFMMFCMVKTISKSMVHAIPGTHPQRCHAGPPDAPSLTCSWTQVGISLEQRFHLECTAPRSFTQDIEDSPDQLRWGSYKKDWIIMILNSLAKWPADQLNCPTDIGDFTTNRVDLTCQNVGIRCDKMIKQGGNYQDLWETKQQDGKNSKFRTKDGFQEQHTCNTGIVGFGQNLLSWYFGGNITINYIWTNWF